MDLSEKVTTILLLLRTNDFPSGPFVPMFARVMNFGNSSEHGNRLAVADQNNSLTFQQLATAVRGVAKMIQGHVTGKHQVVAVLMDRSALYTTSMLGIMRAGCVYLPLNSADPIDRIKGILEDAQATLVITQPNKLDILKDITSVRPLVVSLEEVMKPVEVSLPVIGMKDPCYMIFTSGTTGKPKGVVVPHMALSNLANEMSASFSDVQGPNLALFEFSFDAHLHDVVMSISRGSPLVISKPFGNKDPQYIIDTVNQFKVTTILMVPSMLSMILDYFDINASEKSKFSSIRLVGCGGEALYIKLVERTKKSLPSVRVINNYGPTEACVLCSFYDCNKLPETKSANDVVPIGAAIRNSELLILGEDRNIVPIGVTGQLYIGGDCLALGYANNPQQTQAKFVDHPYAQGKRLYASGDLAKYLPSGEIHFLGRADNQIKLRGYRIECGEIESSILGCSGVKMSSVIVHKSEQREQCLVGFVEFDSSVNNDAKVSNLTRVLGELKTKLPQYMVPTRLVSIDKFPLTSHGKVDTKQLPNPFESTYFCDQHSAGSTGAIKPLSSDAEKKIAKCFAEVLSISESTIGSNSNFFDLGGSSLHAFTLVNKISEALGVKLELKQFFDNASPGELAKLFDAQAAKQLSESSLDRYKKRPLTHYECIKLKEATEAPATNIFLVHGAFRNGVVFKDVASKFPDYVTVYSFQDSTPLEVQETDDHHPPTMEEFADIYVKLLLQVQSSGIYHLAGYCFGGVLVCEMAHQMLQKGCNVCTVALIDSTAPSIVNARGLSDISAPTIFRMISFEIAMSLMGKTSDLTEDDFKHLKTPQQQKQALINAFSDKIDKKILVPFVERALAHFASSSGLLTNYRFKPLRGQITLLSAKEKWALYNYYNPMGINDLGWKSLHENVNVTMTPGDHLTIIRDAKAINVVVDNLVKLLEQEGE
jgi:nonribosomal peptide synthetase DhbF